MRRMIVFAVGIFTSATALGGPISKPPMLPLFDLRGFHAGDIYQVGDDRFQKCVALATGTACALRDSIMAGVVVHQIGVAYGPKGLYALEVKFREADKAIIESALRSKYGKPCASSVEQRMNALGHTFTSTVLTWCFRDGKAVFKSMTDKVTRGSFEFATKSAPADAAANDF